MASDGSIDYLQSLEEEYHSILDFFEKKTFFCIKDFISLKIDFFEKTVKVLRGIKRTAKFDRKRHQSLKTYKDLLSKNQVSNIFVPIVVMGDGNCLFRAISMSVLGTESFHKILRVLTVHILVKYFDFFVSITEKKDEFTSYIESVAQNHNFSGEMEEMALSFIFSRPIINYSIFPILEFYSLNEKSRFIKDPILIIFDSKKAHFSPLLRKSYNIVSIKRPAFAVFNKRVEN
jgi:hypothetical protein